MTITSRKKGRKIRKMETQRERDWWPAGNLRSKCYCPLPRYSLVANHAKAKTWRLETKWPCVWRESTDIIVSSSRVCSPKTADWRFLASMMLHKSPRLISSSDLLDDRWLVDPLFDWFAPSTASMTSSWKLKQRDKWLKWSLFFLISPSIKRSWNNGLCDHRVMEKLLLCSAWSESCGNCFCFLDVS